MLELAINNRESLNIAYRKAISQERNKFYIGSSWSDYEIRVDDSDEFNIQYVGIDKDENITGYYCASIDRCSNIIHNINVINFKNTTITSIDLFRFLKMIAKMPIVKIEWWVIRGNPAEMLYDRIIEKYGGRKVGVYLKSIKLRDGKYYDKVMYEMIIQ